MVATKLLQKQNEKLSHLLVLIYFHSCIHFKEVLKNDLTRLLVSGRIFHMRKSRKYYIKTLSLNLVREIYRGVEKFVRTSYFKKRLEKFELVNSHLTTIHLGEMLSNINTRRRTLFKLFINGRFPMYVEFNPNSCDMGESVPNHHVRINLANIENYQDLRTTIIHELTHLFDGRDFREFAHYSYEDNPVEVSAREMEGWFMNKFFLKKNNA